jgi:hypothetical protein
VVLALAIGLGLGLAVSPACGCAARTRAGTAAAGAATAAPATLEEARARPARPGLFTGCYDTSFGPMLLLENTDASVMGSYVHNDGELLGRVEGQALVFRWREKDTGVTGSGYFLPTASEGGAGGLGGASGVIGRWGYGDSYDDGGGWNGKKFSSDPAGCR